MSILRQPELTIKLRLITQYIYITPLFLVSKTVFLIIYNILLIFIFICIILLFILFFRDKKKITYYNIYISFFAIVLPLISFTFYQIIVGIILSIFQCRKTYLFSTKGSTLECYSGIGFYFEIVLGTICICIITWFHI